MSISKFHIFVVFISMMNFSAFGQTKEELENQRNKYKTEIANLNKLLFKEEKKQENALEDLKDINRKIELRNKLINTINLEAKLLGREISKNKKKLSTLNKNLEILKADYAQMIYKSYKSKSQQSRMMFLLSSQNFYQAYKRLEYMKQYTKFRKKQGEEIVLQKQVVEKLNDSLVYQKKVKDTLILVEKKQKAAIESDQKKQKSLISKIKRNEGVYKRKIRRKIREDKKIAARIDKIIRDEIEKANKLTTANTKGKKSVSKSSNTKFVLSPEAKALAAKFEQNKGKLPWPVNEGLVVRKFGVQPHPIFPGITINSTGVHFATSKGSDAKAIFDGEVINVLVGSGGTKNVLIRHGNYITSYNNLQSSYVKKGDKIVTNQKIGKVFTDKVSKKTTLIFVLFQNTKRLNPSSWMAKK